MAEFPKPGQMFGEYRILDVLGRGGMGVVFRAEHLRLTRQVALKVIAPGFSTDPEFLARFQREAALQASLDSPHIVSVYDHGEIDGYPFIASQLITGGDLSSFLKERGPLSRRDATEMTLQVASALAEAHRAGIVHRDVKPSNVLLRPGTEVFVYLCDFGVAQVLDSELTQAGNIVGTYAYLAPERCEGGPATPASDQYALGCLYVAALTGHAPFQGSDIAVAQQHVTGAVPQIQAAQPTDVSINRLLARLLAKTPQQRFPSTTDVTSELRRLRDDFTSPTGRGETVLRPPTAAAIPPLDSTTLRPNTIDQPPPQRPVTAPSPPARRGATVALVAGVATLLAIALVVGAILILRPTSDDPTAAGATKNSGAKQDLDESTPTPKQSTPKRSTAPVKQSPLPGMTGVEFANPTCTGDFIVIVKTAADEDEYNVKLQQGLSEVPAEMEPKYMQNSASCNGFSPTTNDAERNQVFNLYLGPFARMDEACQARASLTGQDAPLAWIKPLLPRGNPSARRLCSCDEELGASGLADISDNADPDSFERRRVIADAQYLLLVHRLNPERKLAGFFTQDTALGLQTFQAEQGIATSGQLDTRTWQALLNDYCKKPRYPPGGSSSG